MIMSKSLISRIIQRQCLGHKNSFTSNYLVSSRAASNFTMTPAKSDTTTKEFWDKNKDLKRPISPHLTIYKFQLTANLSVLHRATGLAASGALYAGGLAALFGSDVSFPEVLQMIQTNVPPALIFATKVGLGSCMIYHTLNGVRHLLWDLGYGFDLKHLYISGYLVLALTAGGTVLVLMKA